MSTGLNAVWTPQNKDKKAGKHNVNMSWIQRFKSDIRPSQNEMTATLGYEYRF